MEEKHLEQYILWRYPYLLSQKGIDENISFFGENNDYIFYCCYIKTYKAPDYTVICDMYGPNEQKDKHTMLTQDDYLSDCNRGIIGNGDYTNDGSFFYQNTGNLTEANFIKEGKSTGLAIINKKDYSIKKLFYVKDTYNMLEPTQILGCNEDYTILKTYEVSYIINLTDFSTFRIEGTDLTDFNGYILIHPAIYYDVGTNWSLVDVREQIIYPFAEWVDELIDRPGYEPEECSIDFEQESGIIHVVDNITGHEGYTCLDAIKEDFLKNKPIDQSNEYDDELPF